MTNPDDRPENPETSPLPPATTLAEARAACVGRRYPLFEESFSLFDAAGGFRPTFTWPPLVFGLFWFVYRRMYLEALLAFLAGLVMMFIRAAWGEGAEGLVMLMSFGFSLILALTGRWLYWKAVDRRLEQAMRLFPHAPDQALAWLKRKGGVDPLAVVCAIAGLMVLGLALGQGLAPDRPAPPPEAIFQERDGHERSAPV